MRENGVQIESWGLFAGGRKNLEGGESHFLDHRDPAVVRALSERRLDI